MGRFLKRVMLAFQSMSAESALVNSFLLLVLVLAAWVFREVILRAGFGLAEMYAGFVILCVGSVLLAGLAFWRSAGRPVKTALLCLLSCILGVLSCGVLYVMLFGLCAGLHPH
jgi:hypothetical protein